LIREIQALLPEAQSTNWPNFIDRDSTWASFKSVAGRSTFYYKEPNEAYFSR